ncbi:MAG: hypothetical protein IH623_32390 [Verrucomicrobia bacterium]|nr:hypothetical protein [Verrucomicrobiota bacterium]
MRRQYTAEEKRRWNKTYWRKKKRAGFVFYGFCLPKPVMDELKIWRAKRMEQWSKEQGQEVE